MSQKYRIQEVIKSDILGLNRPIGVAIVSPRNKVSILEYNVVMRLFSDIRREPVNEIAMCEYLEMLGLNHTLHMKGNDSIRSTLNKLLLTYEQKGMSAELIAQGSERSYRTLIEKVARVGIERR